MEPYLSGHPLSTDQVVAPHRPPLAFPADAREIAAPGQAEGPSTAARDGARVGLYAHVPFCAVRCSYCDFSSGSLSADAVERYLGAMEREAALRAPAARGTAFTSVFLGGGTPSALSARHFDRLWRVLRDLFEVAPSAEITLEANPESVRPALLEAWARAGVNRLSMGVQSFDPTELKRLGRVHDAAQPGRAFALARGLGFRRLSLDLMFGFPGQTRRTWSATIDAALALEPEHLSAYCFIPEPGTPLGNAVVRGEVRLPSPDFQAELYRTLAVRTAGAGYAGYETSNFCRPGAECRHNLVYWLRRDYVALGPSGHGLWKGVRYANAYALEAWATAIQDGLAWCTHEPESERSSTDEIVMLGLRLGSGLKPADYAPDTWAAVRRRYGAPFDRGLATGRLEHSGEGVRIPPRHRFVADDVIAWLMARAEASDPVTDRDLTALRVAP